MRRKLEKLSLADVKSELELQRIVDYPWNTILPKDVVKRAKKQLIDTLSKEVKSALEKEDFKMISSLLSSQTNEIVKIITDIMVWPYIKNKIDAKVKTNAKEAIKLIDQILSELEHDYTLTKLKRKLHAKKLSLQRKVK